MKLVNNSEFLKKVIKDLQPYHNFDVVLFGSSVSGGNRPNSDIDIAILSHIHDQDQNLQLWWNLLGKTSEKYDIRIFELLPLHVQISLIMNYHVLFGNPVKISEYFYQYRKKWEDYKYRYLDIS